MDFDGDGRLDLLTGSNSADSAAFHLFRRKKDGSWAPRRRFEVTPENKVLTLQQPSFVTAADWNGDGVPDLLIRGGNGHKNGNGTKAAVLAQTLEQKIRQARQKGYEGDPCNECGQLTLVRSGACCKCDTCGASSGCS